MVLIKSTQCEFVKVEIEVGVEYYYMFITSSRPRYNNRPKHRKSNLWGLNISFVFGGKVTPLSSWSFLFRDPLMFISGLIHCCLVYFALPALSSAVRLLSHVSRHTYKIAIFHFFRSLIMHSILIRISRFWQIVPIKLLTILLSKRQSIQKNWTSVGRRWNQVTTTV